MKRSCHALTLALLTLSLVALLTIKPKGATAGPQPQPTDSVLSASVTLYADKVSVEATAGVQITVVLKNSEAVEKGRGAATFNRDGFLDVPLTDSDGNAVRVSGGDTLEIISAAGGSVVIPVFPLTARADWTTDLVLGEAPPNTTISVTLLAIRGAVDHVLVTEVDVDATGNFEVDYSQAVGLAGGDHGSVAYRDAGGNIVRLEFGVPTIKVQERGNRVEGTRLWHNVEAGVALLSADGIVRTVVTAPTHLRSDLQGSDFDIEMRDRFGNPVLIRPGDTIEVRLPGVTLPVDVVPLTAHADTTVDQVAGTGPAQSPLVVELYQSGVGWRKVSVSTDADGEYVADFGPGVDIQNGDFGNVSYTDSRGQVVWLRYAVPLVQVQVGGPFVEGFVAPGTPISTSLTSLHGTLRATGFATSGSSTGYFRAGLRSPWDRKVQVQAGDRAAVQLQGSDEAVMVDVPPLTAVVDANLQYVSGTAPPNATLRAELRTVRGRRFEVAVETDSAGRYAAIFEPHTTIEAGDTGYVYYTLSSGHQVYAYFDAPWIWLSLDSGAVGGQALPNVRVTGRLRDQTGALVATGAAQADERGKFSLTTNAACGLRGRPVPEGRLDLTFADRRIQLDIPRLTASVDAPQDIVTGLAPPGGLVKAQLTSRWAPTVTTHAATSGEYSLHLSGQTDLKAGDYGFVAYVDPSGHEIRRNFAVPGVELQLGVSRLAGWMPPDTEFLATVYASSGIEKASAIGHASDSGLFSVILRDMQGHAVSIEGGDRLELSVGGDIVVRAQVPALRVHMQVGSNQVTGTGPPLQEVEIHLDRNLGPDERQTVITDAAGQYAIQFEGPAFAPGDYVQVYATDADGNRFSDRANTLWMSLEMGSHRVSGRAGLGASVIVHVRDGSGVERASAKTRASRDRGGFDVALYDPDGRPVPIFAGDQIEITADDGSQIQVVVPPLTLSPDLETDVVTGVAPENSTVAVTLSSVMGGYYRQGAVVDETGHYAVSLKPYGNLRYGDVVSLSYTGPEGFPVLLRYALPWLNVELNSNHVEGRAPYSTTVSVRLLSSAGEELAGAEVVTDPLGAFDAYLVDSTGSPAMIGPGQVVEMTLEGVSPVQFAVPELTASADLLTATVVGRAVPESPVVVELRSRGCTYMQEVLAGDDGNYVAWFRYVAVPAAGDYGWVYWNSTDGNGVFSRYGVSAPPHRMFLPLLAGRM